jgi:hypothetical protein
MSFADSYLSLILSTRGVVNYSLYCVGLNSIFGIFDILDILDNYDQNDTGKLFDGGVS